MQRTTVGLATLIESGALLSWQEAVALVRSLAALGASHCSATPSRGTFEEFVVHDNGDVSATLTPPPRLSVSELALLLARLLPGDEHRHPPAHKSERRPRPPASLHVVIASALGLVDGPVFTTVQAFSRALARFERADARTLLRDMFNRCAAPSESADRAAPGTARANARPRGDSAERNDRRRQRVPSDLLRRLLREEDRRNYLGRRNASGLMHIRRGGPSPEMLRRLMREADERNYALARKVDELETTRAEAPARRWLRPRRVHKVTAVLILVAGALLAERGQLWPPEGGRATPSPPVPLAQQAAPVAPARQVAPVFTGSAVAGPPVMSSAEDPKAPAPTRRRVAARTRPAPRRASAPAVRRPAGVTRSNAGIPDVAPRAVVLAPAVANAHGEDGVHDEATTAVKKRRGPLPRFFSAVYRGLGKVVLGPPRQRPSFD